MAEEPGNQTPNTPHVSEEALRATSVDELRSRAVELGVAGAEDMHKPELIPAVAQATEAAESGTTARSGRKKSAKQDDKKSGTKKSDAKQSDSTRSAKKDSDKKKDDKKKSDKKKADQKKADKKKDSARKQRAADISSSTARAEQSDKKKADAKKADKKKSDAKKKDAKKSDKAKSDGKKSEQRSADAGGANQRSEAPGTRHDEPGNQTPNTPSVSETALRNTPVDELRSRAQELGVDGADAMHKPELVPAVAQAEAAEAGEGPASGGDPGAAPRAAGEDLAALTVAQLKERAKEAGVTGVSGMKKDDLVQALASAPSPAASDPSASDDPTASDPDDLGAGPDDGHVRTGERTSKSLKYAQEIASTDDEPERQGRSLATTHHQVIREWAEARGGTPATVEGTEKPDGLGVLRIDFGEPTDGLRPVSWEEWFATFDLRQLNFVYQEQRSDGHPSTFFILESPNREDA